jgi:hypothetical protein
MNRNNYIYTWQYNRNPFIDYPALADYIWGANVGQPWYAALSTNENSVVSVSIYPNPTSERFTVYGMDSEATLVLFNSLGMKVFEQEFSGETTFEPQVAPGIYFVKIAQNNQSVTKKIIIK